MTIKIRNALFLYALFATLVAFASACCRAMTAQCLACKSGVSVEEYCKKRRWTAGCKRSPGLGRLSDESSFENFRDVDVLDEAVGGILSAGRKFLPHSTPIENGAKIFI